MPRYTNIAEAIALLDRTRSGLTAKTSCPSLTIFAWATYWTSSSLRFLVKTVHRFA